MVKKIYCSKCGIESNEDSNFCNSCGFSLQNIENIAVKGENKGVIEQFIEVFKRTLSSDWSGRFSRREFAILWVGVMLVDFLIMVFIILSGFDLWLESVDLAGIAGILWFITSAIILYSAAIRRFHDLNESGWNVLLLIIPIISFLTFIYLLVKKGKEIGGTRWG